MHEFNTGQRTLCGVERLEPQHGPGDPLDAAMILSHDIIEILDLADDDRGAMLLVVPSDGGGMSLAAIAGDLLGHAMATDCLVRKRLAACWSRCSVRRKSIVCPVLSTARQR